MFLKTPEQVIERFNWGNVRGERDREAERESQSVRLAANAVDFINTIRTI